jgi:hypothetical protein
MTHSGRIAFATEERQLASTGRLGWLWCRPSSRAHGSQAHPCATKALLRRLRWCGAYASTRSSAAARPARHARTGEARNGGSYVSAAAGRSAHVGVRVACDARLWSEAGLDGLDGRCRRLTTASATSLAKDKGSRRRRSARRVTRNNWSMCRQTSRRREEKSRRAMHVQDTPSHTARTRTSLRCARHTSHAATVPYRRGAYRGGCGWATLRLSKSLNRGRPTHVVIAGRQRPCAPARDVRRSCGQWEDAIQICHDALLSSGRGLLCRDPSSLPSPSDMIETSLGLIRLLRSRVGVGDALVAARIVDEAGHGTRKGGGVDGIKRVGLSTVTRRLILQSRALRSDKRVSLSQSASDARDSTWRSSNPLGWTAVSESGLPLYGRKLAVRRSNDCPGTATVYVSVPRLVVEMRGSLEATCVVGYAYDVTLVRARALTG